MENEILEQILSKLNNIETNQQETNIRLDKLETKVDNIETNVSNLNTKVDKLEQGQNSLKSQTEENTQILKALEHRSKVNSASLDKINNDISHMQGDVSQVKTKIADLDAVTMQNHDYISKLKAIN